MNYDKLSKLIQLANNNSNNNEANLAARKVCQLLKDYKFDNSSSLKSKDNSNLNDNDFYADFINKFYSKPPKYQARPGDDCSICADCKIKAGFNPIYHEYICPKCGKKWQGIQPNSNNPYG